MSSEHAEIVVVIMAFMFIYTFLQVTLMTNILIKLTHLSNYLLNKERDSTHKGHNGKKRMKDDII